LECFPQACLGGPGIGYTYDYKATHQLENVAPDTYKRVAAQDPNHFLFFPPIHGLDGQKAEIIQTEAKQLTADLAKKPGDEGLQKLNTWYTTVEQPYVSTDKTAVTEAVIYGGRRALQITSAIPASMACCYLLLVFYFIARGGYKAVHLDASGREYEVAHTAAGEEAIEAGATTSNQA